MNYIKIGTSKNYIVFLHGWGADLNSFLWLKNYYQNYSLVFIDFKGFGKSPEPSKPYRIIDYTLEIKKLLDTFEIEKLVIVGHSFGGRVAIKYSFLYQNEYIDYKLCLVDSAGIKPKRGLKYYFRIYKYKFYKRFFPNSKAIKNCGSLDYKVLSDVMKKTFINVVNEDLTSYAKFITAKTKIIWGKNDKETKMYMARKLNKIIKNSSLNVIRDAGHFSFLDKPRSFVIILDTFLKY